MSNSRIAFVEWPEALSTDDPKWGELKSSIGDSQPDILVTNELPFGPWIAESADFSEETARVSIRAHEKGLEGLISLNLPAVISSRPVWTGKRLANEEFAWACFCVRTRCSTNGHGPTGNRKLRSS